MWILIVVNVFVSGYTGNTVSFQEFTSLEKCQHAAKIIDEKFSAKKNDGNDGGVFVNITNKPNNKFQSICVPK